MVNNKELHPISVIRVEAKIVKGQLIDHCYDKDFIPKDKDLEELMFTKKELDDAALITSKLMEMWVERQKI